MQQHCDPEDLALISLGEPVDPACQKHADTCPQCRAEVDSLREVVVAGRASGGPETLQQPPPQVWARIREQMATEPVPLTPRVAPARPRWLGLAAAVVAGILIGGASVAVITGQGSPEKVVASAALTPLPDGPDRGGSPAEATLNSTDGGYTVTVKAPDLAGPEGFYEVWLLSPDDSGLIALGSLAPGETEATFPVPPGVDLQTFTAVDVSDEPLDGDPGHSTVTVLRGTLTT